MGTTIIFDWEAGDNILIKCERVARVGGQVTAPPTRDGLAVTSKTGYQASLFLDISWRCKSAVLICPRSHLSHLDLK